MGWFESDSFEATAHTEVHEYTENVSHKPKLSHEVIAGAAAYEAAKAYEDHAARNGHPDEHAKAKEIIAGFAGAFIDRMVETKGLDYIDRQKAKNHANEKSYERYEVDYQERSSNNY